VDGLVNGRDAPRRIAAIGLTGGIGSGKSTAAACLVDCGAWLVDTDAIARALTLPGGAAIPALAAAFGADAIAADGGLDREKMRRQVFADAAAKARLEAILHPLIGAEARRRADAAGGRPVVFDVPLLAESSPWRARVDRILVIDCEEATQLARVAARPGWTEAAAHRVLAQQATRAARRSIADAVIHNDGLSLAQFQAELRALWALWRADEDPTA
jgi:dephospho-CoA kinase